MILMIILMFVFTICGIKLLIRGFSDLKAGYFLAGLISVIIGIIGLGYKLYEDINENDMKKSYKFNILEQMRFDDYGFGLFVIGNELCFKSVDGKTYTVGSGNEISVCDDAKVKPLEE